jgi:hypothetical protein
MSEFLNEVNEELDRGKKIQREKFKKKIKEAFSIFDPEEKNEIPIEFNHCNLNELYFKKKGKFDMF